MSLHSPPSTEVGGKVVTLFNGERRFSAGRKRKNLAVISFAMSMKVELEFSESCTGRLRRGSPGSLGD